VDRVAGIGVGVAAGWNIAVLGAVATRLADAYGIGLTTIGLFVTVQFAVHMAMQVPGGRAADRFGAKSSSLVGLGLIAAGNAVALPAPVASLGFLGRVVVGVGTGLAFIGGSDYVRARDASGFLQGLYGGGSILAPGAALVVVPLLADVVGWRAPYLATIALAGACALLLALAPAVGRAGRHAGEALAAGVVRDRRLYPFCVVHAMSFGYSVVVGNWVVTLLEHHGHSKSVASLVGSLTLLLGFFTRIAGGLILGRPYAHRLIASSLVLGGAGAILLALPLPLWALLVVAAMLGLAAGLPFAAAFTGAAQARPDAPGAAVGFVNACAALVIVVGTPLVGLTFSLPGDGRIGFAVLGAAAALAALATPR
jgi:MFS family permease